MVALLIRGGGCWRWGLCPKASTPQPPGRCWWKMMTDFTREEVIDIARKLLRADLRNIDLSDVELSYANLSDAKYNANTKWPAGFDPVARGAVLVKFDD